MASEALQQKNPSLENIPGEPPLVALERFFPRMPCVNEMAGCICGQALLSGTPPSQSHKSYFLYKDLSENLLKRFGMVGTWLGISNQCASTWGIPGKGLFLSTGPLEPKTELLLMFLEFDKNNSGRECAI